MGVKGVASAAGATHAKGAVGAVGKPGSACAVGAAGAAGEAGAHNFRFWESSVLQPFCTLKICDISECMHPHFKNPNTSPAISDPSI